MYIWFQFYCLIWISIQAEKKSEEPTSKINCAPEKPDFKWNINRFYTISIIWLPSRKEGKCNGEEVDTHFSVQYKALDSNQWFKSRLDDIRNDTYNITYLFPGKIYEVLVTSESNNFKTDSDLQEMVLPPWSSPVQSVNVISLTNTSVLISWKPPLHSIGEISGYYVTHNTFNKHLNAANFIYDDFPIVCSRKDCRNAADVWGLRGKITDYRKLTFDKAVNRDNYEQIKVSRLKTGTTYTFHIMPEIGLNPGFAYTFEYMLSPQLSNDPLAKPGLRISLPLDSDNCFIRIEWLPCGRKLECKNRRPGSAFKVEIKNAATGDIIENATERVEDYYETLIENGTTVNVTVTSIDGRIKSDIASETFTCVKKIN